MFQGLEATTLNHQPPTKVTVVSGPSSTNVSECVGWGLRMSRALDVNQQKHGFIQEERKKKKRPVYKYIGV